MTRKRKRRGRGEIRAADGGLLCTCPGCGFHLCSTNRMQDCPRCGTFVCRVCAEDRPHKLPDGSECELPAGQEPKYWGLEPSTKYPNPFPKLEPDDKQVRCSTTE